MSIATVQYLAMIQTARLDAFTSTGFVGDEVTLSVNSLDPNASYEFYWGDDGSATGGSTNGDGEISSSYTYTDEGDYTVEVRSDFGPGAGRVVFRYRHSQAQKTAAQGATIEIVDEAVEENTEFTVSFAGMSENTTLRVDWGDDESFTFDTDGSGEASGPYTYAQYGDYTITVTDDDDPSTVIASLEVSVAHREGSLGWADEAVVENEAAALEGTGFAFDRAYTIDWGDESEPDEETSDGTGDLSSAHTYAEYGEYTVTVSDGEFVAATLAVTVDHRDGSFAFTEDPLVEDSTLHLEGSGFAFARVYTIDWDDSTPTTTATSDGTGDLAATHMYAGPGTYTVTVSDGAYVAASLEITVTSAG